MRWALEEATAVAVGLPDGGQPLRIGVKVPAGYVATGTLVADVEHALRAVRARARSGWCCRSAPPTVAADDERIGLDVATLRLMGVHVALDGFGSGSSALAHLTRLPIDIVKLDRSLITRIDRDPQSRALCESVVGIGRALGLDVVAEGVETPAQLAALADFGCGFAQGFLIARRCRWRSWSTCSTTTPRSGRGWSRSRAELDGRPMPKWTPVSTWWDASVDARA